MELICDDQGFEAPRLNDVAMSKTQAVADHLQMMRYVVRMLCAGQVHGDLSKKVFKISERELATGEVLRIERRHPIRPITTRVYYPGTHRVAAIANGVESPTVNFVLRM